MATAKKSELTFKEVRTNLKMAINDKTGEVHIVFDPKKTIGLSKSGKSNNVASTRGNMDLVELDVEVAGVKAGINIYRPA